MLNAPRWFAVPVLVASLLARTSAASETGDARFSLTPYAGWTVFDQEYRATGGVGLANGPYFGGRAGVRMVSPLWLEFAGGVTEAREGGATNLMWSHLSANLLFISSQAHALDPFVSLGAGVSQSKPQLSADRRDGTFEAAAGVVVRISDVIGLRLEGRNVLLVPERTFTKAHFDDVVVGAGLAFRFGGTTKDTDGDGVPDRRDMCPDTPRGCRVDGNGCPMDSDHDGVCDGLDLCPGTPHGVQVDAHGCPTDQDGDGVFDGIDVCPGTPRGCTVDAKGCPLDADHDGVCDGVDQCPNTIAGCKVDAKGCPIDTDGDGVCDGLDRCPNTPTGATVDASGCTIDAEVQRRETELLDTGLIRLQDVNFETARATILPESYARLDVVGQVLGKWPQLEIEIGGHCDSRGGAQYNLALSQRRANAVRAYLLAHFTQLEATRLLTRGYGESQPLVPNTNSGNMARNRRVEFKVLNKEVLRQLKR